MKNANLGLKNKRKRKKKLTLFINNKCSEENHDTSPRSRKGKRAKGVYFVNFEFVFVLTLAPA